MRAGHVTVKSDQEEAMKSIVTAVGRARAAAGGDRMAVEMSPVGQSQSNAIAERAIQAVRPGSSRMPVRGDWGCESRPSIR